MCGSYAVCKILGCPARHVHTGAHRVSYTVNWQLGIVRGLAGVFWAEWLPCWATCTLSSFTCDIITEKSVQIGGRKWFSYI